MQKFLRFNCEKDFVLQGVRKSRVLLCCSLLSVSLNVAGQTTSVTKVLEYVPAPGQFVNASLPKYEAGDTDESIRAKAESTMKAGIRSPLPFS